MVPTAVLAVALGVTAQPLEFAGVTLNATPIETVTKCFGEATRWKTGDAGDAEDKVCYRVITRAGSRYVHFIVGELGAGVDVTQVRVTTEMDGPCVVPKTAEGNLARAIRDYENPGAMQRRLLALGFSEERPWQWARCLTRVIGGKQFDDCASVQAQFRRDTLVHLELSSSLTN